MSLMTLQAAAERAASTDPESPVAIFRDSDTHPGLVDVRIANTLDTRRRIETDDPALVGVYDSRTGKTQVLRDIQEAKVGEPRKLRRRA